MKIALFGASGFVGSNLAHKLSLRSDYEIFLFDIEDKKLTLRFENAPFPFEQVDISKDITRIDEIVSEVDVVFDLAAFVHPAMFISNPLDVVKLNFFDCLNVIRACVKHKTRLIHFSTSEVYGKTGGSEASFHEDQTDLILGPIHNQRWIYSCAKQLLDRMIYAYGAENDLNYTLVRPFNFVGPLMDKYVRNWSKSDNPRVFANFMSSLVFDRPLQLVDGGQHKRCFTYIDDAIDGLLRILESPEKMNKQIVNLGNPENEASIAELAQLMANLYVKHFESHSAPRIVSVNAEQFYGTGYEDCDRRMPDISKMRSIGWEPQIDLEDTLLKSMRYFMQNKDRLVEKLGE